MKKVLCICCVMILLCALAGCTFFQPSDTNEPSTEEPSVNAEDETEEEPLLPLLDSDETHDVFLYGIKPKGLVLYVGGEGHYYDRSYDNAADKRPQLGIGNYKYGSKDDIAILFPQEKGDELCIITNGKYDEEDMYTVDKSQIDFYAARRVKYSYENEAVTFSFDDAGYIFDISESFENLNFVDVSYAENVRFEFADEKIYVNIVPVVVSENSDGVYETVDAPISVRAELVFDGAYISLTDFTVNGL